VEGTELLNIEAVAPKGELQIQQMLPIRGNYQMLVKVTPIVANAFTPIEQTLTLSVPESWVKYRNFGILAVILLAVGLGGGLVLGGQQQIQPGEIAPQRVRLLLSGAIIVAIASLLIINITLKSQTLILRGITPKPRSQQFSNLRVSKHVYQGMSKLLSVNLLNWLFKSSILQQISLQQM
jgi:hypothetical protein